MLVMVRLAVGPGFLLMQDNARPHVAGPGRDKGAMAAAASSYAEDLTCSICLNIFTDPVSLVCGHSFCRQCITLSLSSQLQCPQCRAAVSTEGKYLQTNHILKSLAEKAKEAEKVKKYRKDKELSEWLCPEHEENLKLFCVTDQRLTCVICRDGEKHEGHKFKPIREAAASMKEELNAFIGRVGNDICATESQANTQREEIRKTREKSQQLKTQIHRQFEEMHQFLRKREDEIQNELKYKEEDAVEKMNSTLKAIETSLSESRELQRKVTSVLKIEEPERFLKSWTEGNTATVQKSFKPRGGNLQVVNSSLSLGPFESHLQFFVWKEMLQVIQPRAELLSFKSTSTDVTVSDDGRSLFCSPQSNQTQSGYYSNAAQARRYNQTMNRPHNRYFDKFVRNRSVHGVAHFYDDDSEPYEDERLYRSSSSNQEFGVTSGQHYWEIEVGNRNYWELGIKDHFLKYDGQKYTTCSSNRPAEITFGGKPRKIGIYLDCSSLKLSFYDADIMTHIHTLSFGPMSSPLSAYLSADYSNPAQSPLTVCWFIHFLQVADLCPEHEEKLKLFCVTDQKLTCVICRDGEKHEGHKFKPIREAAASLKEELNAFIGRVGNDICATESQANTQREEIRKTREKSQQLKTQIHRQFEEMHQFLRKREDEIQNELKYKEEDAVEKMNNTLKAIETSLSESRELQRKVTSVLKIEEPERFLKSWTEGNTATVQKSFKPRGGNLQVVNSSLSLGPFESHLQFFVWKEMLQVIQPRAEPLSFKSISTDVTVSDDGRSLFCSPQSNQTQSGYYSNAAQARRYNQTMNRPHGYLNKFVQNRTPHGVAHFYDDSEPYEDERLYRSSSSNSAFSVTKFTSGQHYWEIEVGNRNYWELGIKDYFLKYDGQKYTTCSSNRPAEITFGGKPRKIGIYLDCSSQKLSFYDADIMRHIHTLSFGPMSSPLSAYLRADYSNPAQFPLTVCWSCITDALSSKKQCPQCRTDVHTEGKCLPASHVLKSLAEKAKEAKTIQKEHGHERAEVADLCPEHEEKLKLFCVTDQKLTCVICRDGEEHEGHKFKPIREAAACLRQELKEGIEYLSEDIIAAESQVNTQEEEIRKTKEKSQQLKTQIHRQFEEMHQFLRKREDEIQNELKYKEEDAVEKMNNTLKAIETSLSESKELQRKVTSVLKIEEPERFLKSWTEGNNTATTVQKSFKPRGGNLQVVNSSLSLGPFESHLQFFVWKEMLQVIQPRAELLSFKSTSTDVTVSDDGRSLFCSPPKKDSSASFGHTIHSDNKPTLVFHSQPQAQIVLAVLLRCRGGALHPVSLSSLQGSITGK
ncbi:hypothetical protein L3Q82_015544 [Scortum barcoo]|uniref:Uncharacterized protein n=1 Tax=Scortum barcoo TaxID=214431 RepID=A0ACB8VNG4_9TELE|nr:hypothetical protein L3Q82_015544 [Scortum barcoo]